MKGKGKKMMIIFLKVKMMVGRRMLISLMLLKRLMMVKITMSTEKLKMTLQENK